MAELIKFTDGVMIEIAQNATPTTAVSGKAADRLTHAFQESSDAILAVVRTVVASAAPLLRDSRAGNIEIELAFAFSLEGNVYIAKSSAEGNLSIKVTMNGETQ